MLQALALLPLQAQLTQLTIVFFPYFGIDVTHSKSQNKEVLGFVHHYVLWYLLSFIAL